MKFIRNEVEEFFAPQYISSKCFGIDVKISAQAKAAIFLGGTEYTYFNININTVMNLEKSIRKRLMLSLLKIGAEFRTTNYVGW